MLQSGDIEARITELEDLVGHGEPEQFFKRLIDLTKEFGPQDLADDALILSGEYRMLERDSIGGISEPGDYRRDLRLLQRRGLQMKSQVVSIQVTTPTISQTVSNQEASP